MTSGKRKRHEESAESSDSAKEDLTPLRHKVGYTFPLTRIRLEEKSREEKRREGKGREQKRREEKGREGKRREEF